MGEEDSVYTPVHVGTRDVPPPRTISPAARKGLSDGAAMPRRTRPAPDDMDAWLRQRAAVDAMWETQGAPILAGGKATFETVQLGGVLCHDCVPSGGVPSGGPAYIFVHGGAFVAGGGPHAKALGVRNAGAIGVRTISVDYRMAPENPFPAAPEDCLAVYQALIETIDPRRIVIGGSSAGGNIAASTILMARDRGLPLPAGAVLLTPEVDLTESGDTFRTNEELDVVLKAGLPEANAAYASGHDYLDPYLSPLFADFSSGFPPTMIQSGTRDLFLSNSVLIHRKLRNAGIDAELHIWEAMPHGQFLGDAPENAEVLEEVTRFIRRVMR